MRTLLGRGARAALLLVTALGLALGLATTTVYDHPAESSAVESLCLTFAAELAAPPSALPDDGGAATGDLVDLVLAVITVAGVVFVLVLGRARLPRLLLLPRELHEPRGTAPAAASVRRAPSRPLLLTLSVIRI